MNSKVSPSVPGTPSSPDILTGVDQDPNKVPVSSLKIPVDIHIIPVRLSVLLQPSGGVKLSLELSQ